jgi:hypothetical protein
LVPVIGEEERQSMKEKIKYTNEPLGKLRIIEDFLPPLQELAFIQESVKVTIALSKASGTSSRRKRESTAPSTKR